jgi:hypothetical protein
MLETRGPVRIEMRGGSVIQSDFCAIRTFDSSSFDIHTEPYQATDTNICRNADSRCKCTYVSLYVLLRSSFLLWNAKDPAGMQSLSANEKIVPLRVKNVMN